MRRIVECIPNFSEGRRPEVIEEIVRAIESIQGAVLLDHESDPNHNRSVVTFVASPEQVVDAAIAAARRASELIDLTKHAGEHPRMGATDVIPFVPISGITMDDCVQIANQCGRRMWEELQIPVYLYEKAAKLPERENLAAVRKGQFEGIRDEIESLPFRKPDFGDPRVHPTAGITAVGARPPLIAYNVNLGTDNIEIANKIARAVRHQTGGLRYVKALGFDLKDRGIVQVSMNMVNYEGTPLHRAFEMIKREAERYGVPVVGSEIVGLVPQRALDAAGDFYLQLENFTDNQILENRLAAAEQKSDAQAGPASFPELVAAGTPVPGGGSVAAHSGVLAVALGRMVCNLTIGKKKYSDVEEQVRRINSELEKLGRSLEQLVDEDASSFEAVMSATRLPKETEQQKSEREKKIQDATLNAAQVPLATARTAEATLKLLKELAAIGNRNTLSDLAVAAQLGQAAVKGAHYNVSINLSSLTDRAAAESLDRESKALVDSAVKLAEEVEAVTTEKN